ncbi:MAG: GH39 family glycosyl hydrolase [Paracoccaceae bacterium]
MKRLLKLALCAALWLPLTAPAPHAETGATAHLTLGGASNATARVFAFGGGVWRVPKVMRLAEPTLEALGHGGTTRAALAWELLAQAKSPEHAAQLLQSYPLNAFLKNHAAKGGTVIITLDATPLFLAMDRSAKQLADGPAWAKSPIASEQGWADLTTVIVRHFKSLGINAIYEVWNEPDHALRGSVKDYIRLYRATTLGARRADPRARIAGPAVSDWMSVTSDGRRFVADFIAGAAQTPVPQLGLNRLPVNALTYHSFNRVPGEHHARVMADMRALMQAAGYKMPPVYNTEWNIAAEPPYPEGDLNGVFPNAAHIGATLIAMANAGLRGQVFQMMVDPGGDGYHAGVLTAAGTPRAAYHAFALARPLAAGQLHRVETDSAVVTAMASKRGNKTHVLVAVFPPTDLMLIRNAMEETAMSRPALFRALSKLPPKRLLSFFNGGKNPASGAEAEALNRGRARYATAQITREAWRNGGTITLTLPAAARLSAHQVIDKSTAPQSGHIRAEDAKTKSQLETALRDLTPKLRSFGMKESAVRQYGEELGARVDGRQALAQAQGQIKSDLTALDQQWVAPAQARIAALAQAQSARLARPVQGGTARRFTIKTQAYGLHLLTFSH